jgi:hypothetical protein
VHQFMAFIALIYVDPWTGGLLFQLTTVIFAAVSSGLFFSSRQTKSALARLRRFFSERGFRS